MRCGVLALQGDWAAHGRVLTGLGVAVVPVRTAAELAGVDALVMPGGESTAMLRLMAAEQLDERLTARIRAGLPVLATCAGVILLAATVRPAQPSLKVLDVDVERNAYGRQLRSAVAELQLAAELGGNGSGRGVFIRAPRVLRVGPNVRVLGRRGADPVLLCQDRIVAATYHPELTGDLRVHRLLLQVAEEARDE